MTYKLNGGEGGIRTPDTLARMPHFECGAFDHSATSPAVAPSVGTILFEGVAPGGNDGRPDGAASNQPRHWSAPCERAGLLSKPGPRAQGPRDTIFTAGPHSGRVSSFVVLCCDRARRNAAVPHADPRSPAHGAIALPGLQCRRAFVACRGHAPAPTAARHSGRPGSGRAAGEQRSAFSRQVRAPVTGCRANRSGSFGQTTPGRGASSVSSAARRSHAAASCWR